MQQYIVIYVIAVSIAAIQYSTPYKNIDISVIAIFIAFKVVSIQLYTMTGILVTIQLITCFCLALIYC